MDNQKGRIELSRFAKEIEKAIFNSEILRSHLTVEMRRPDNWIQKYNVVYRNFIRKSKEDHYLKENQLNCIRLTPRIKKVQRNLSAYDREGNRLIIVPSQLIMEALIEICNFYLQEAKKHTSKKYGKFFDELKDCENGNNFFEDVFIFTQDANEEAVCDIREKKNKVKKIISELESKLDILPSSDLKSLFYLMRIYSLITTYINFYIPIIKLENPLEPRDCILINYSVENMNTPISTLDLDFSGNIDIISPLELESKSSNHFRIQSPSGVLFRKVGVSELPENSDLYKKYVDLSRFMDDEMIYFYIPKEDALRITEFNEKKLEEGENYIKIKVSLGISKNFMQPSLIKYLTYLMYLSALLPLIVHTKSIVPFMKSILSGMVIEYNFSIIMTSIFFTSTILISLAIYCLDKRFLHDYLALQMLFVILLYLFGFFWPTFLFFFVLWFLIIIIFLLLFYLFLGLFKCISTAKKYMIMKIENIYTHKVNQSDRQAVMK